MKYSYLLTALLVCSAAYADLLLVEGNPLDDIEVLTRPAENLVLIMKDGSVHKNTIQ